MFLRTFFTAFVVWLSAMAMGHAATLTATGATNLEAGGVFYDVTFTGGTCAELFDGCDDVSDFGFGSDFGESFFQARLAGQALAALFNAPGNEDFTNSPSMTDGCEVSSRRGETTCEFLIPFGPAFNLDDTLRDGFVTFGTFFNQPELDSVGDSTSFVPFGSDLSVDFDVSGNNMLWAVFTEVTPVPVPASLPLLGIGLAGLMALGRRRKRQG